MIVNKPYTNKEYADLASYCNKNNCHIEDKGDYLESVENKIHILTYKEVEEIRARLYEQLVDPITSHIQRLRDDENPDEEKIAILIIQRSEIVEKIKNENPYPEE